MSSSGIGATPSPRSAGGGQAAVRPAAAQISLGPGGRCRPGMHPRRMDGRIGRQEGKIGARQPLRIRPAPQEGLAAVASRSHNSPATEAYLDQFDVATRVSRGSSLKLCMVACGEADLYPRLAPTMEWDIAAGDAVLRAAGGSLSAPDGTPMRYGKPRFFNVGFVAAGDVQALPIAPFLGQAAER